MTCNELTNDQMLAPTAAGSSHLSECEECRERQQAVILATRALRALADERPVPEANDQVIRAAIPQLAADAARRRPAGWWQVAAAAAVLLAAVIGGLKYAAVRDAPSTGTVAGNTDDQPARGTERPSPDPGTVKDPGGTAPTPPIDPTPIPPLDPGPGVKTPPDLEPPPPPGGRGYLAGGDLPPLPKPPVDPGPPPHLPQPAGVPGDLSVADCMEIMRTVIREGEPVSRDINGDGLTDVADALIVAKRIAEKEKLK
ncbi:MAG: actin associated protein Wsp1 [Planctomycetota bacterium]|nr:MAG: actin associated protein Wsp1 [Planctomycetota bacterium]